MIGHSRQRGSALIALLGAAAVVALIILVVIVKSRQQTPKIQTQRIPAGAGTEYERVLSTASLQCGDHIALLSVTERPNGTGIYLFTPGKCSSWFVTNVLSIAYGGPRGEVRPTIYSVYKSALSAPVNLDQWKISSRQAVDAARNECPAVGRSVVQSELSTDPSKNVPDWNVAFSAGNEIQVNVVRVNATDGTVTCNP